MRMSYLKKKGHLCKVVVSFVRGCKHAFLNTELGNFTFQSWRLLLGKRTSLYQRFSLALIKPTLYQMGWLYLGF